MEEGKMLPPQRATSHSSRRSGGTIAGNMEQFGRSESSLHAERASASLRGARTEDSPIEARAMEGAQEGSSPGSKDSSPTPAFDFAPSQRQRPSLSPPSSQGSPVTPDARPAVLASSSDGPLPSIGIPMGDNATRSLPIRPTTSTARLSQSRQTSQPSLLRPAHKSTPDLPESAARSSSNPITYQDLGMDYTRYYNPFSETPRSSFSEHRVGTSHEGMRNISPLAAVHPANPFATPNASASKLHILYDPEKNVSIIDDRLVAPYEEKGMAAWPLIGDKAEEDDEMHMPHPDDDIKYKPTLSDHFTRDSIISTFGLLFMIIGLLFIFIALPVMSFGGIINYSSSHSTPLSWFPNPYKTEAWAVVNDKTYPFLQNIRRGLIDPDTPKSAMQKKGAFGDDYELVFSDEFNDDNRTFYEGDDPYFYAGDFWYGATRDLEWYDPDAITTRDGTLEIKLEQTPSHGLQYRSGMLNSWNHLCFKGGIFEVSVSLPGPAGIPGLWPGAWTMGNLGRPGYLSTTDGMWPYTYQACDVGITPNQSSSDGLSNLPGQRLSSCTCPGEDHPTPGTGRGAPEIDIIEVGATYPNHMPIATQSYQVAPFDIYWYPNYNFTAFPDYSLSWYNGYTGGPYQQAISATTNLNKQWYDGNQYQRYSFEYVPGEGKDAYINWKIGDQTMFMMDGRAIGPNGNIQARQISEEPMSLILNLGFSESWTFIDRQNLVFPATMRVDYVRWYQKKGETMVTCDPPGFETTQYIKDHINAYTNPNFTQWDQTGHAWPKHKLNSKC